MNTDEFSRCMRALPEPTTADPPQWNHWRHDLWQRGQSEDPNGFMGWPCIYHTMLVNHWDMSWQLAQLQADDAVRWEPVIRAPTVGIPPDLYPGTPFSKNLINQAYHLLQWELRTGKRIDRLNSILEIGGGYGAMALVCRRLGFTGTYTICDLLEFTLLQQWWLDKMSISVEWNKIGPADLLMGIYSLSEMPLKRRAWILKHAPAKSYLMVYSHRWEAWDNLVWFTNWTGGQQGHEWRHWPMVDENNRPDWYAVGWRT